MGDQRRTSLALENLRGVSIAFVLMRHANLAYLISAPERPQPLGQSPYLWVVFPRVDARRRLGFFCGLDVYLMYLLFFVTGLFVLTRRGRDLLGFAVAGLAALGSTTCSLPCATVPTKHGHNVASNRKLGQAVASVLASDGSQRVLAKKRSAASSIRTCQSPSMPSNSTPMSQCRTKAWPRTPAVSDEIIEAAGRTRNRLVCCELGARI